jgi:hypothetical protein
MDDFGRVKMIHTFAPASLTAVFLAKACCNLTLHFVFAWSSLSIVKPIMRIIADLASAILSQLIKEEKETAYAIREKIPSHSSSDLDHILDA